MGIIITIIVIVIIIALCCGANLGEAIAGVFVFILAIAQYLLPIALLAWLISLFLR